MPHPFATIILAAGKGTRMQSSLPKVMHRLAGQPLVSHVLAAVRPLNPDRLACVIGPDMEQVEQEVTSHGDPVTCIIQSPQQGTGHAVQVAKDALAAYSGPIIILYGDTPLLTRSIIDNALNALTKHAVAVIGMRPADPAKYGRLQLNAAGDQVDAIIEYKDANEAQRALPWCNSGIIAAHGGHLWDLLDKVDNKNASSEYYLTDVIGLAQQAGLSCALVEADEESLHGINTRAELAAAEARLQQRLRAAAMEKGVTLVAPETVFLSADTRLGSDVIIHPHVVIREGVTIDSGAEIKSFSHLEHCHVKACASIGPYARLRPGAEIAEGAFIGNFVEIKNANIAKGAKISHLSYIGDADIGQDANVGAGTITCNYDGYLKHRTTVGEGAFIGSNSALVAPVHIGKGAIVGAGSTITEDVPADATGIARGKQVNLEGHARNFKEVQAAKKKTG